MKQYGIGKTTIKKNPVKKKLEKGEPSVGLWLTLCSPASAEAQGHIGWDWLLVDIEHSPIGFETMLSCFRAIQLAGSVPMARVPWKDTIWIQRTLDAGAMGLVIPMVNNKEDALFAIENTLYATRGIRSFGGIRLAKYLEDGDYGKWCDENLAIVVQIETVQAVENLEEILTIPGITACYIGPYDLMLSMGVKEKGPGTEHDKMMLHVLDTCKKKGVPAGLWCANPEEVSLRISQGFQFINCSGDERMMIEASQAAFAAIEFGG
jgi:2-keto-3-deoxy-L-rhamnonate aldolase RhmA